MAPPKAWLPQRLISNDFLGINWTKVMWMAPYNNFYPITMTAGQQGRALSSFMWWGNKEHRMSRNVVRHFILAIPTFAMALIMFLQSDTYQIWHIASFISGMPVPQYVEDNRAKELIWQTRHKPGVVLKHKYGGQVSIPGSEELVGVEECEIE